MEKIFQGSQERLFLEAVKHCIMQESGVGNRWMCLP